MEKKVFLLTVDGASAEQRDAFTDSIKQKKCGFWHWIADAWIIADPHVTTATALKWRDRAMELFPTLNVFVVEIPDKPQWGVFAQKEAHSWLHQYLDGIEDDANSEPEAR